MCKPQTSKDWTKCPKIGLLEKGLKDSQVSFFLFPERLLWHLNLLIFLSWSKSNLRNSERKRDKAYALSSMILIAKAMEKLHAVLDKKVLQTRSRSVKKKTHVQCDTLAWESNSDKFSHNWLSWKSRRTQLLHSSEKTLPSECFTLSIFVLKVLAEFKGNCQQHQMPYCPPFPHDLQLGSYWEVGFPLSWEGTTATEITLTQRDRLDFLCIFLLCLTFIASSYHILDGEKPCLRAYWAHTLFGRSKIINDS